MTTIDYILIAIACVVAIFDTLMMVLKYDTPTDSKDSNDSNDGDGVEIKEETENTT